MKLLLAEDQKELSNALVQILKIKGFETDAVYDGQEAYEHCKKDVYNGIILDIMMPKMDGIQVLKNIREENIHTPVLMLTAKADVEDRINGLNMGADDYLAKPFNMQELIARINAMIRSKNEYLPNEFNLGNTIFDTGQRSLMVGSNSLILAGKEAGLLTLLLSNAGRLMTPAQIIENLWAGEDEDNSVSEMELNISYLKSKLKSVKSNLVITKDETGISIDVLED